MEIDVLPTLPAQTHAYPPPGPRSCRSLTTSLVIQTIIRINSIILIKMGLLENMFVFRYPLLHSASCQNISNQISLFNAVNKFKSMNCDLSLRQAYYSSATLNPEKHQDCPLEFINDHIFEQALQVKKHLKGKTTSKTGSNRLKTPDFNAFEGNQSGIMQKQEGHHQTRETCTPSKLSFERRIRIKREVHPKKTAQNDINFSQLQDECQNQLFGKISIHCLRARKQKMDNFSQSFQSEYNYVMNKLQRLQKAKEFNQKKSKKLQQIAEEKRRNSQQIQETIRQNQQINKKRTLELKRHVLSQRAHKEQMLEHAREQKKRAADSLRKQAYHLQHERSESQNYEYQQKQVSFMKEKFQELQRKNYASKMAERRRREAKIKFKNRWISEFQSSQKARDEMLYKKELHSRKMVNMFERMKSLE